VNGVNPGLVGAIVVSIKKTTVPGLTIAVFRFSCSVAVAGRITNGVTPAHTSLPVDASFRVLSSICNMGLSKYFLAAASSAASKTTNGIPFASAA
jgi:hypothetical protein